MTTKKVGFLGRMLSNITKRVPRIRNSKRVLQEIAPNESRSSTIPVNRTRTITRTRPRPVNRTATRPRSGIRSRISPSPDVAAVIKEINEIHNVQNDANTKLKEIMDATVIDVKENAIRAQANATALKKKAESIVQSIQGKQNISQAQYEHAAAKIRQLRTLAERNALNEQTKAEALLRKYDSRGGKNAKRFRKQRK